MAQFTNQAQLSYNNLITNSNIAVGEILEVLSATKTAVRDTYGSGDTVTYIISVVNSGSAAFTGLTLTDNLGAYPFGVTTVTPLEYVDGTLRYFNNGVLQTAPTVTAGPPLVISGITIPADGNATIIYEAATDQYAPLGADGSITNSAVLSGGGITPITVSDTVTAETEPVLTITKSVSPVPVVENGTLTYTFLIQNTGNAEADAAAAVALTDTFDPILSDIVVTFDGTRWVEGTNYTYSETNGVFASLPGQITVPAATFTQDTTTGSWVVNPGVSILVISGTI